MTSTMTTERAFQNSQALAYVLFGLSLLAFSLGALLQVGLEFATRPFDLAAGTTYAGTIALLVATIYFGCGVLLLRNRPRAARGTIPARDHPGTILIRGAMGLGIVVALFGLLFAFASTAPADSTLASLLILSGLFGVLSCVLYRRNDINVRAAAAIVGFLAGVLLLFAQLRNPVGGESGSYGTWEMTSLVLPRIFGPIAVMVAALSGLILAYSRSPRPEFGSYFLLSLAALIYGVGLTLAGLAFFFETPWSSFVQVGGADLLTLAILTAGGVILTATGICILNASLIGLVRNGQGIGQPAPAPPGAIATTHGTPPPPAASTATRTQRADHGPPTT
ncbi:MAG TPA: hypothetical protein VI818_03590 [Candidatus Thermoplasmatota archaeon]|nr:hypothetical protein [Candidatus Thermoplasmatota archaeon]